MGNCTHTPTMVAPGLFQLVLNAELYEGLRYGWLHVQAAGAGETTTTAAEHGPNGAAGGAGAAGANSTGFKFTVTGINAVCQVLPLNYIDNSFEPAGPNPSVAATVGGAAVVPGSGAAALAEVWYTAMYTTRVDLLPARLFLSFLFLVG